MKKRDTGLYLNSTNFQRLFLVSTMTAAKFLDDFYYSNKHWAQIGGITTQEINRLELEFLFRMGFSLHMQREEYDWYAEELLSRVDCTPPPHIPDCHDKENGAQDNRQAARAAGGQAGAGPMLVAGRSSNPSPEDPDAFLSTHTTPKSSSSHMHEAKQQVGAQQIGMSVLPTGPAPPMPHAPGHAVEMHARVPYPVHGSVGAIQPVPGMVHPAVGAVGAGMPVAYHAGGLAQAPLVYF